MFIKIIARLLCIAILFVSSAPHFGLGIEKSYAQSALVGSGNLTGSSTGNIWFFRAMFESTNADDEPITRVDEFHIHGGVETGLLFPTAPGFNTATHRNNRFIHVPTPPTASLTFAINPAHAHHRGFGWNVLGQRGLSQGTLGVFGPSNNLRSMFYLPNSGNSLQIVSGFVNGGPTTHSVTNLTLPLTVPVGISTEIVRYNRLGVMLTRRVDRDRDLFNAPIPLIPSGAAGTIMGTVRMDYSIPYQIYEPFIENIEITAQGFVRITVNSGMNVETGIVRLVNPGAATLVRVSYVNGRAVFEDRSPQLGVTNQYHIMFRSDTRVTTNGLTAAVYNTVNETWKTQLFPSIHVPTDPIGQREIMSQLALITTRLNTINSVNYLNEFGDIQTAIAALRVDMASFENAPSYRDSFLKVMSKLDLQGTVLEKEIPGQRAVRTNSVRLRIATKDIAGLQMSFDGANWQNVPAGYFEYPLTANPGLKRITVFVRDSFGNAKELRDTVWRL